MFRLSGLVLTLACAALPLAGATATAAAASTAARHADPLAEVGAHLRAIASMTADFTQTDRKGATVSGTLTLKRPGKVRFEYQKGVPILIVGDGKTLRMIDYQVKQVTPWQIGSSPLGVLLDPGRSLKGLAQVLTNDGRLLVVSVRDRAGAEWGTTTLVFARVAGAPAGLSLQGWTAQDVQNNRTTIRLSNQRFNVPVADAAFDWVDPRPKKAKRAKG